MGIPVTQVLADAVAKMYEAFEAGQEVPEMVAEAPKQSQKMLFD